MKILVIGGHGSLGSEVCEVLAAEHEVVAPTRAELDLLQPDSVERVFERAEPEVVINCAAFTDVDGCEREPEQAFAINGEAVERLARGCGDAAHLIQVSTDFVFDGRSETPYGEEDPCAPVNVYGKSKLRGEEAARKARRSLVARTSMLMGRRGKNFATRVLEIARSGGEVRAVTDWIGSPSTTFDVARALRRLVEQGATGTLHVASPGACSRYEQAEEILEAAGARERVTLTPIASASLLQLDAARPRLTALSVERLKSCGIELPPRQEAIAEFVRLAG